MGGVLFHDKNQIRKRAEERREMERRRNSEIRQKNKKKRKSPVVGRLPEDFLRRAYLQEGKSMQEIANACSCSTNKVAYWITAYSIPVRSQSEAIYKANHKNGDTFSFNEKEYNFSDSIFLAGLGFGLYWGAGMKAGNAIRIGSDDPKIIKAFVNFLSSVCGVNKDLLHFELQIPKAADEQKIIIFWTRLLSISRNQFQKNIRVTSRGKLGKYGYITLYFYNTKLRQLLIDNIRKYAE